MSPYLKDLTERVLTSFAGGTLAVLPVEAFNVVDVDWRAALGIGAGAAAVSLLKGLIARRTGPSDSAGLGT
jgi:hypothetical protein